MSLTRLADVEAQIKKYWSDLFLEELKESSLIVNLLNKQFSGEIKKAGNEVQVSQIIRPTGATKTIGTGDYDVYSTEKFQKKEINIKADKIFECGYEFDSLVELQSQIGEQDSKIRSAMREAIDIQINNFIYSLISCTNKVGAVADYNATQIVNNRIFAGQKKWRKDGDWYNLVDPSYYGNLLSAQTLTSADYVGGEAPMIAGQIVNKRGGFGILEDNSDGLASLVKKAGGAGVDQVSLAFHRDFLHLVLQGEAEFKVSDLHAMKRRGYLITCEVIGGGAKGHDHDNLHRVVYND